jgi:hypothetical protein
LLPPAWDALGGLFLEDLYVRERAALRDRILPAWLV